MYSTIPSQLSSAAASCLARQFELCSALNASALTSMTKLLDVNMHVVQDALLRASTSLQQMPPSDSAAPLQQVQLAVDGARAYRRQVVGIVLAMGTKCTHLVQGSITAANAQIDASLGDLTKNAPDGASGVLELMRAMLGNVNQGYDQLMTTSEQAAQAVVASLESASPIFAVPPATPSGRSNAH
jgi:hypothetical protein